LTAAVLAVELIGGLAAGSLALLSDAGHILTDLFALGLAWFALGQASKPATARLTYGYHRVGIITATLNAAVLIVIVAGIGIGAGFRLLDPHPVRGVLVAATALLAMLVNTYIALSLRRLGSDLNLRAAMLHVLADIAASGAVLVGGLVIMATGWVEVDPILSLAIGGLIGWGSIRIIRESVTVLLESAPVGLDVEEIRALISRAEGIHSVHDLHVWSIAPQRVAMSCHVVVDGEQTAAAAELLVEEVERRICESFGIGHTTIQIESANPCRSDLGDPGNAPHNHPQPHTWSGLTHRHDHYDER
jgi:cobalt-zinc-cadmium efflux system protein